MRSILLLLLGIPLPIIILIAIFVREAFPHCRHVEKSGACRKACARFSC